MKLTEKMKRWVVIISLISLVFLGSAGLFMPANAPQDTLPPETDTNTPVSTPQQEFKIETVVKGSGVASKTGDALTIHYEGSFEDGTVFDSSYGRNTPFEVKVGTDPLIPGFTQALLGMKVGEKRRVVIPPELGYGAQGAGDVIPPNTTLVFIIELLGIKSE